MEYWIQGATALSFEQPLPDEVVSLIRKANPGYMGVINLCRELAQMGVNKPVGIRTPVNNVNQEIDLDIDLYWP